MRRPHTRTGVSHAPCSKLGSAKPNSNPRRNRLRDRGKPRRNPSAPAVHRENCAKSRFAGKMPGSRQARRARGANHPEQRVTLRWLSSPTRSPIACSTAGPNPATGRGVPLPARTAPRPPSAMPPSAAAVMVPSVDVPIVMPCAAAFPVPSAVFAVPAGKSDRATTNRHKQRRKQNSHFFILQNVCSSTRYSCRAGPE